jgi:hypothetical protein
MGKSQTTGRSRGLVPIVSMAFMALAVACGVEGHGHLYYPRSRNWVARQDGLTRMDPNDPARKTTPKVEYCPHCLNRYAPPGHPLRPEGGYCGVTQDGTREYTKQLNIDGEPMEDPPLQAQLVAGSQMTFKFTITAHHKGHVELGACCGLQPSQSCFDQNRLMFVEDLYYGAPKDPNHPERGYLFPNPDKPYGRRSALQADDDQMSPRWNGEGMDFNMVFELPREVHGDRCIIQWRYYTANSCEMPGYDQYDFPGEDWRNPAGGYGLSQCGIPLSNDGSGFPERFWNCADVEILPPNGEATSGPTGPAPTPPSPPPTALPEPSSPSPPPQQQQPSPPPPQQQPQQPQQPPTDAAYPLVEPWGACGGRSNHPCSDDRACAGCKPYYGEPFECVRSHQWYWQCKEASPPPPPPTPMPGSLVEPWGACGGKSSYCQADMKCNECEDWNGQPLQCIRSHEWYWQCTLPESAASTMVAASTMAAAVLPQAAPASAVCGSLRRRKCGNNPACEWHGSKKKAERHCMPKTEELAAASSRAAARSMNGVVASPSYRGAEPLAAQWNGGLAECAPLKRRKCKKSLACAWDRPARQCIAEEPGAAAATAGGLSVCSSLRQRKCKKNRACAWDSASRQCATEDPAVAAASVAPIATAPAVAAASVAPLATVPGARLVECASLRRRKCRKKRACAWDPATSQCAEGHGTAAAQGLRKRRGARRVRKPCAELPPPKCLKKARCAYDAAAGACGDAQ